MSSSYPSPAYPSSPRRDIPAPLVKACLFLAALNAGLIAGMYVGHSWLFDADGRFIATDYVTANVRGGTTARNPG